MSLPRPYRYLPTPTLASSLPLTFSTLSAPCPQLLPAQSPGDYAITLVAVKRVLTTSHHKRLRRRMSSKVHNSSTKESVGLLPLAAKCEHIKGSKERCLLDKAKAANFRINAICQATRGQLKNSETVKNEET